MNIIPNVPPKAFSFSAVLVGYLLIDDLTANEQNALGNWLMLVAQVLCTNAFYKQVQQERGTSPYPNAQSFAQAHPNGPTWSSNCQSETAATVAMLEKMVCALEKEIAELKSQKD